MLGMAAPMICLSFVFTNTEVLFAPFDIPRPLKSFFQFGIPEPTPNGIGLTSFYIICTLCDGVFFDLIPFPTFTLKPFGKEEPISVLVDQLTMNADPWDLETADQDLLALLTKS